MLKKTGKSTSTIIIAAVIAIAIVAALAATFFSDPTAKKGSGLSPQFGYDLDKLRQTDPQLITYHESTNPFDTGFSEARSIALDSRDKIYLAGDNAIAVLDTSFQQIARFTLEQPPRCLAVDNDGTLFVAFRDHVKILNPQGKVVSSWPLLNAQAVLTSIAVDKNNVYLADAGNRIVLRYDKTGQLLNKIGEKNPDRNISGFSIPSPYFDLALATDGLLRVTNPGKHLIEAFTTQGDREFAWGTPGSAIESFCGCCNPINFALLPNNQGFVTAEKGLTRIKIYNPAGEFSAVVAGAESFTQHDRIRDSSGSGLTSSGLDLAVNSQGTILVLDPCTAQLRIFNKKPTTQNKTTNEK
ncbi:MAG: hypothetical protein JXD22_16070 [Sedimentisphaerales bacterium]|nr:hypothetical protein [Sedimentisphaerales bacterium]